MLPPAERFKNTTNRLTAMNRKANLGGSAAHPKTKDSNTSVANKP